MTVDYNYQLAKQLRYLETSCREYDAGDLDEAIRIAQAMRVMFHNTGQSTSLLRYLAASSTELLSTCRRTWKDNPSGYWPGLIQIRIDVEHLTITSLPKLAATPTAHRMVPFTAWWDGEVVHYAAGRRIKRRQLVLDAANKDGGAHVADSLPADYQWMVEGTGFSLAHEKPDGWRRETWLAYPHLACLRQMAYEVLNSPALLALASPQGPRVAS